MTISHKAAALLGLCSLAISLGCHDPTEAIWLEGAGYRWELFNHRVSHVELAVDDDGARASIVGGTSTTGEPADLPDECDGDTCSEFPFLDTAPIQIHWVRVSTAKAAFGTGQASLLATADGDTVTVTIDLPREVRGDAHAVISGFSIDTDHELSGGENCYNPRFGWHPRRIALEILSVTQDGTQLSVEVAAVFEAGNSLEHNRVCVDDVVDQAQVPVLVDLVAMLGPMEAEAFEVSHGKNYGLDDDQPDPDLAARAVPVPLEDAAFGWRALDYRFHVGDAEGRGAYLRSLSFVADAAGQTASGHATNYSPGTQLSGFDYEFAGVVQAFSFDGEITRGVVEETVEVELAEDGTPVVYSYEL